MIQKSDLKRESYHGMEQNSRFFNISLAGVVSAIAVVILHTNGVFWQFSAVEQYWFTANIIESVCYFAVPVFFMITGATLLSFYRRYGLREYFRKRAEKVLIPYLFWSMIGILVSTYYMKSISPDELDLRLILNLLAEGKAISVYWFFIPLFTVYLCIPLLAAVRDDLKMNVFRYIFLASFVLNAVLPFLNSVFHLGLKTSIKVPVGSQYLIFVLLGYLLQNSSLKKRDCCLIYVSGLAGLLMLVIGTYYSSMAAGSISSLYKGYVNVPSIMYSAAVFTLIRQAAPLLERNNTIRNAVLKLSGYTFPMFLVHKYVLTGLVKLFDTNTYSLVWRLGGVIPITLAVVLFTALIRKIPVVRKILP